MDRPGAHPSPSPRSEGDIETPTYQERVFFVGANGSGKTILEAEMLRHYPRVVVLDIKYDFPVPWDEDDYALVTRPPMRVNVFDWFSNWHRDRIVYRPAPPYDSGKWITYFLDQMFARGRRDGRKKPFILALDEGGWVAYSGAKQALARLAIAGRSLGIGLWIAAQRPRGIPVEVRSEAWRMYVFFLRKRDDRLELLDTLDDQAVEQDFSGTQGDYWFWEIRRGEGGKLTYRALPPVRVTTTDAGGRATRG
jgi:hypothetical protein